MKSESNFVVCENSSYKLPVVSILTDWKTFWKEKYLWQREWGKKWLVIMKRHRSRLAMCVHMAHGYPFKMKRIESNWSIHLSSCGIEKLLHFHNKTWKRPNFYYLDRRLCCDCIKYDRSNIFVYSFSSISAWRENGYLMSLLN